MTYIKIISIYLFEFLVLIILYP